MQKQLFRVRQPYESLQVLHARVVKICAQKHIEITELFLISPIKIRNFFA